jgi:hypothetical protein
MERAQLCAARMVRCFRARPHQQVALDGAGGARTADNVQNLRRATRRQVRVSAGEAGRTRGCRRARLEAQVLQTVEVVIDDDGRCENRLRAAAHNVCRAKRHAGASAREPLRDACARRHAARARSRRVCWRALLRRSRACAGQREACGAPVRPTSAHGWYGLRLAYSVQQASGLAEAPTRLARRQARPRGTRQRRRRRRAAPQLRRGALAGAHSAHRIVSSTREYGYAAAIAVMPRS